jgi:hypothetical protein
LLHRADVDAVYAVITELDPGKNSWPFSDTVVVVGTIDSDALQAALAELQPDEVGLADTDSLGLSRPDGVDALVAWWD